MNKAKALMKEHPILFSTEMVRALLEGRKTMTRRIMKDQPLGPLLPCGTSLQYWAADPKDLRAKYYKFPYGDKDTTLWVRESGWVDNNYIRGLNEPQLFWKADYDNYPEWQKVLIKDHTCRFSSIHMYRDFCRLFLKIADIRVERLHDISEENAKKEGAQCGIYRDGPNTEKGEYQLEYNNHASHRDGFRFLWQNINGEESWNSNPWVWCLSFEKLAG